MLRLPKNKASYSSRGIVSGIGIAGNDVNMAMHHPLIGRFPYVDDDIISSRRKLCFNDLSAFEQHLRQGSPFFCNGVKIPGAGRNGMTSMCPWEAGKASHRAYHNAFSKTMSFLAGEQKGQGREFIVIMS